MSRKPRTLFRPLHGIVLLDKPQGLSSNQALQRVRHLFRAEKGGHTGALDPLATGLLPVCLGEATKIAGLLLGAYKAYETVAVLGSTTDTDDADGVVLQQRSVPSLTDADIEAALRPLTGVIQQRAPIYSALKQGGEPLYAKARRGEAIDAPVRQVDVRAIRMLARDGNAVRLRVECGSGTYIRSLVRDLGEALGCGAHVSELRRLWVEPFLAPTMWTLEALESLASEGDERLHEALLPLEAGLAGFPRVVVDPAGAVRLGHGQPVHLTSAAGSEGVVAVFDETGRALGLGVVEGALLKAQRLFIWAIS